MRWYRNHVAGWIDSTVHDFLEEFVWPPPSMAYALITCLGGCRNGRMLLRRSSALRPLRSDAEVFGEGIVVRADKLLATARRRRIFFGTDEVWFFTRYPVNPVVDEARLTGPTKVVMPLSPFLERWLMENRCCLGLGDGMGLNFICRLTGLARHLVTHCTNHLSRPLALPVPGRAPLTDDRLLGTWKSDKRRTWKSFVPDPKASPESLVRFKSLFGKLVIRYTRNKIYTEYEDSRSESHYEVIAKDSESVAIRDCDGLTQDSPITHIHFEGNYYWICLSERLREFFRKLK